jgi:hypothetical protein
MTRTHDESMFRLAYGSTDKTAWQCQNIIVANESVNVRRAHKCCSEDEHTGKHECGCGQTWWYDKRYKKWRTAGPLTDVATCDDIEWSDRWREVGESAAQTMRGEDPPEG